MYNSVTPLLDVEDQFPSLHAFKADDPRLANVCARLPLLVIRVAQLPRLSWGGLSRPRSRLCCPRDVIAVLAIKGMVHHRTPKPIIHLPFKFVQINMVRVAVIRSERHSLTLTTSGQTLRCSTTSYWRIRRPGRRSKSIVLNLHIYPKAS